MNNKRLLSSPEYINNNNCKKHMKTIKMANPNGADIFSWEKMREIFDEKLKEVVKKEDLFTLKADMEELKEENLKLKTEIKKLTSRIEFIDRRTRLTNIVVSGIKCNNVQEAKAEFIKLCSNVLKIKVNVISTRKIAKGKSFIFNLESSMEVNAALDARGKLKGSRIYIQKDYTDKELNVRYNLRKISKNIRSKNKNAKVRLGEFCIFINDKRFMWSNEKIVAQSNEDGIFLNNLLAECGCSYEICSNPGPNGDDGNINSHQTQ